VPSYVPTVDELKKIAAEVPSEIEEFGVHAVPPPKGRTWLTERSTEKPLMVRDFFPRLYKKIRSIQDKYSSKSTPGSTFDWKPRIRQGKSESFETIYLSLFSLSFSLSVFF